MNGLISLTLLDWMVTAIGSGSLVILVTFLAKNLILTRLTASVNHDFNSRLEQTKADLKSSYDILLANVQSSNAQVASLQSGALSGAFARQALVDKRSLEAIDDAWAAYHKLGKGRAALTFLASINVNIVSQRAVREPELQEFAKLGGIFDVESLAEIFPWRSRPYLSASAWAVFQAYQTAIVTSIVMVKQIQAGLDLAGAVKVDLMEKVAAEIFPDKRESIRGNGFSGVAPLLERFDELFLLELQKMLAGEEADKALVARGQTISRLVEQSELAPPEGFAESATRLHAAR